MTEVAPRALLLEIARCPVVEHVLAGDVAHPCAGVVRHQRDHGIPVSQHQVPEPWDGDLPAAPILFVSSNPSINPNELYPRRGADDDELLDFFPRRFGGGSRPWIAGGSRTLRPDGTSGPPVRFLSARSGAPAS